MVLFELDEEFSILSQYILDCKGKTERKRVGIERFISTILLIIASIGTTRKTVNATAGGICKERQQLKHN